MSNSNFKGYLNEVSEKPSASTSWFKGYLNEVGRKPMIT